MPVRDEPTDAELQHLRNEKRVALVIGNGDYRNFHRLDNPANDARGVAAGLRVAGFEVTLELVPVAAQLDAGKSPADLAGQVAQEAVDLAEVLKIMGDAGRRLNIVILNACRDNPFTTQAIEVSGSLSRTGNVPFRVGSGLAQTSAPPRTFLAYATAPGQVASEGNGRNSPYSGALAPTARLERKIVSRRRP